MTKTLLVFPTNLPVGFEDQVAAGRRARTEILELAAAVRTIVGGEVELLDYDSLLSDRNPLVVLLRRTLGYPIALAVSAFMRLNNFDSVFTNSEMATVPLAVLTMLRRRRPKHVSLAFHLTNPNTRRLFHWLPLHRQIDRMFVYCNALVSVAVNEYKMTEKNVQMVWGFVDSDFYRPDSSQHTNSITIGSAGSARRDYVTLIKAAAELDDLSFVIVPSGHPLRLNRQMIPDVPIPPNVRFAAYEPGGLRKFYATCDIVCVPVHDNSSTAGMSTLLEAMAMGKPVIATRTSGLRDYIFEGETCLGVDPGDTAGWKTAIRRLCDDPELRNRLGRNARCWVEQNSAIEIWASTIADSLKTDPPPMTQPVSRVMEEPLTSAPRLRRGGR